MVFSKEQEKIFEFAQKGFENLIVSAVAGAGKTTTLVECAKKIKDTQKILLLAHNRSTKDTLKERIGDKPNIHIYTLHGLAFRIFTEEYDFAPNVDDDKYRNYVNQNIENIGTEFYHSLNKPQKMMYKANVFELINKARHNLKQSEKEIRKLAIKKYGIRLIGDECQFVSRILKWGFETKDVVDYQDLLWFPYESQFHTKRYLSDIIMLDEAQDASPAQQYIISLCFRRNTRLFAFGDPDQAINSWCGSDSEAFEHLKDATLFRRIGKEFPLTTNYRCGRDIIAYAKKYTDKDIKASENAPNGLVRHNVSLNEVKNGDMILCRNISPLMDVYRKQISLGKKIYFRGEELGKNLIDAVDCTLGDSIKEIIQSMKIRLIATWTFLQKDGTMTPQEASETPIIVSLFDTIKTMESLPPTVDNRQKLYRFIKEVFSDEAKDGIELSTIHRAKGLEADNVFIICPSLLPSRLARMDWEIEEEKHLQYVMCTRPKLTLNFVTEQEVRSYEGFAQINYMYRELMKIKNETLLY